MATRFQLVARVGRKRPLVVFAAFTFAWCPTARPPIATLTSLGGDFRRELSPELETKIFHPHGALAQNAPAEQAGGI